jgi:hypothetical protein
MMSIRTQMLSQAPSPIRPGIEFLPYARTGTLERGRNGGESRKPSPLFAVIIIAGFRA